MDDNMTREELLNDLDRMERELKEQLRNMGKLNESEE